MKPSPIILAAIAPPSIVELLGRYSLTAPEYRRVFAGHDPGDEDPRARNYGRFVCRVDISGRRACSFPPHHFGPHEYEPAKEKAER